MPSEILETFEYQGQIILIRKGEEDPIKEFARSVRFDIESQAQQKLERALRGEWIH